MARPLYGAGAYSGSNPIGGGNGYVSAHGYTQATADYVVTTWAAFKTACAAATSGMVIWIPSGVTLVMSSGDDHPTLKTGVVVASNRGQNGAAGGKIKNPYTVGGVGNYMSPCFYASSNCVISGITLEGPGCFASTSDSKTNAAIRCATGAKRVEVENCEIFNFFQGGVYIYGGKPSPWNLDSSVGRHWIHHCKIHGMQRHGFGYGVQLEGNGSALIECCDFYDCRHFICGGNSGNSYEIRYCTIGDSWYRTGGTGAPTGNTQLDAHGGGPTGSIPAGDYMWMHHNTLSANNTMYSPGKENIGIRGVPTHECKVYNNWTKKTYKSGGPYSETASMSNHLACTSASGGGAVSGNMNTYHLWVYDNWYGTVAPPGDDSGDDPDDTTAPIAEFSANVTSGVAPLKVNFTDASSYSPTSWHWTFGDGSTSTSQSPSHTYSTAGQMTVVLTVANAVGSDSETKTAYIEVTTEDQTHADFVGEPLEGERPLTVEFSDLSTNADTWSWTFGDGDTSTSQNPSHTYDTPGVYDVALEVTYAAGASALDVGAEAVTGSASPTAGYTDISLTNPLNASGQLSSIEVWAMTNCTGLKVGTFYNSGTGQYTCRSVVELGNVTSGSKQTYTTDASSNPISLTGVAGDYIGYHIDTGTWAYNTGGTGLYYKSGDQCVAGQSSTGWTLLADRDYSIYASGSNAGATLNDTETKTSYVIVTGAATSDTLKLKVVLTPKSKLRDAGYQIGHMLANSKGGI
ncbi:MAG: PKD domain-containing protein [Dehalococcoidia bacterium]